MDTVAVTQTLSTPGTGNTTSSSLRPEMIVVLVSSPVVLLGEVLRYAASQQRSLDQMISEEFSVTLYDEGE